MSKRRDLSRSLDFRYFVDNASTALTNFLLALALALFLIAATLAAIGPLTQLTFFTWADVSWWGVCAVAAVIIGGIILKVAKVAIDLSHERDNRAAEKGLSYLPYEPTESGVDNPS